MNQPQPETMQSLRDRIAVLDCALKSIFDFIDDGDSPCVGQIVQDGLVANAYVNLVNLIEVAREDTGIVTT